MGDGLKKKFWTPDRLLSKGKILILGKLLNLISLSFARKNNEIYHDIIAREFYHKSYGTDVYSGKVKTLSLRLLQQVWYSY